MAILAGDFLLARASVSLASLRNNEVVLLMSQVLENLVAGEILQVLRGYCAGTAQVHCKGRGEQGAAGKTGRLQ